MTRTTFGEMPEVFKQAEKEFGAQVLEELRRINHPLLRNNMTFVAPVGGTSLDEMIGEAKPHASGASDAHYSYSYKGVRIDPYRIMDLYRITHPAHQHALKKLLRAGRSVKDLRRDIEEVRMTLDRWLAMLDEDGAIDPKAREAIECR